MLIQLELRWLDCKIAVRVIGGEFGDVIAVVY